MKYSLLTTVSLIALTAAAPPGRAAPAVNWTGCYVGAHAGHGWGKTDFTDTPNGFFVYPLNSISADPHGFLGGAQVGCNYQFAPMWVVGLTGRLSAADISGNVVSGFFDTPINFKTDWLGSVTARVGYGWNHWLLYAQGGAAFAHNKYSATNYIGTYDAAETRTGWTVGAGLEWAFADNWSAMLEYAFYDFGTRDITLTSPSDPIPSTESVKFQTQTIMFGVNYHFNMH